MTAQLICLGQAENAVGLLLDSDPGDETYMADQLLACLIQATADRGGQDTTASDSTIRTSGPAGTAATRTRSAAPHRTARSDIVGGEARPGARRRGRR